MFRNRRLGVSAPRAGSLAVTEIDGRTFRLVYEQRRCTFDVPGEVVRVQGNRVQVAARLGERLLWGGRLPGGVERVEIVELLSGEVLQPDIVTPEAWLVLFPQKRVYQARLLRANGTLAGAFEPYMPPTGLRLTLQRRRRRRINSERQLNG